MNPAEILLPAAPNFRDFGGYANADGRRVRRRRLFRSELLMGLPQPDLHTLAGLDIGLVCDLRSPGERQRMRNQWPADCTFESLSLDVNAEMSAVQPDRWSRRLADPTFDAERALHALIEDYRRMPASYVVDLRALFERLVRPDAPPLLVHCAAGKDRTGFVCAMLLRALDVPESVVMDDYMATVGRYTYERLIDSRLHLMLHMETVPPHAEGALRELSGVRPEMLRAALEAVEQQFGGTQRYLEAHCGLTTERRRALHAALLEPAA